MDTSVCSVVFQHNHNKPEEIYSSESLGGERKKDKPQMEGIREKEEAPQANDNTPSAPSTPQAPSPSSNPPSPHPPQPQRQLSENKGSTLAKRFLPTAVQFLAAFEQRLAICLQRFRNLLTRGSSAKRGGMERSQSSTWDSGEENRNKLVKAASTSKLLSKVVKNAEKHRDPVISQAKMSTREKNSQDNIDDVEKQWKVEFHRWSSYMMHWKSQFDHYSKQERCTDL
ncbi:hypothetical protein cypCar_00002883 [Cyprinus carpio]|nr:hypothetical protein cypCar_00002883 [Cyprinus carpio]